MNHKPHVLAAGLVSLLLPVSLLASSGVPVAQAAAPFPAAVPAATAPVVNGALTFNPVAAAKGGSVTATFVDNAIVKGRPVILQWLSGKKWTKVGSTVKLDAKGVAVFKVTPKDGRTYRASAAKYVYKVKKKKVTAAAVVTAEKAVASDWKLEFSDDFSGTAFSDKWVYTETGNYKATNRYCSAPAEENATVAKGFANLKMTQVTDKAVIAEVTANAKASQEAAGVAITGCPGGVFKNAHLRSSTYTIKEGIVAAEITFPIYQGMHSGVWLYSNRGAEIDMVEAFGWRKGLQTVLHFPSQNYSTPESEKWNNSGAVSKSSWWSKSHVFSVEFTRNNVIFRVDGVQTKKMSRELPDESYYIRMSMLSSDWETGRLKKPVNGGKKAPTSATKGTTKVNWVRAWTREA